MLGHDCLCLSDAIYLKLLYDRFRGGLLPLREARNAPLLSIQECKFNIVNQLRFRTLSESLQISTINTTWSNLGQRVRSLLQPPLLRRRLFATWSTRRVDELWEYLSEYSFLRVERVVQASVTPH